MTKRKIFALTFCLAVSGACVTGAWAQVTVSAGMALSSVNDFALDGETGADWSTSMSADNGFGANLLVDYLLPISIPLSLGLEVGINNSVFNITQTDPDGSKYKNEEIMMAIPLLFRVAYHFDIAPKFDVYVVGKIGYVLGFWYGGYKTYELGWDSDIDPVGGLGYGIDVGLAYYFNSKLGIFVEAGFDGYMLKTNVSGKIEADSEYEEIVWDYTINAPFSRLVTFGFSAKM